VLAAPIDPNWGTEDRDFKARAKKLIDMLK
jgi:hypothetical protein